MKKPYKLVLTFEFDDCPEELLAIIEAEKDGGFELVYHPEDRESEPGLRYYESHGHWGRTNSSVELGKFVSAKVKSRKPKPGFVYVLSSPLGCKIGCTSDPEKRLKTIIAKMPFECEVAGLYRFDDMYKAETSLHRRFKAHRSNGEWFGITAKDVKEAVSSLATGGAL